MRQPHILALTLAATGACADCSSPDRICMVTVVMDRRPRATDVHVVLVDEELGY